MCVLPLFAAAKCDPDDASVTQDAQLDAATPGVLSASASQSHELQTPAATDSTPPPSTSCSSRRTRSAWAARFFFFFLSGNGSAEKALIEVGKNSYASGRRHGAISVRGGDEKASNDKAVGGDGGGGDAYMERGPVPGEGMPAPNSAPALRRRAPC